MPTDVGPPEPAGNRSPEAAPHGVYRCRGDDRWCAISVGTEAEWAAFKQAIGNPVWTGDTRWATPAGRRQHADEIDQLVTTWTVERTAAQAMLRLQQHDVAAGVVQNARDLADDPQLKERGFYIHLDHPEFGLTTADANPIKLSSSPAQYTTAAPIIGHDDGSILQELIGLSPAEIAELRTQGVISPNEYPHQPV